MKRPAVPPLNRPCAGTIDPQRHRCHALRVSGFSLVEVLVAYVVLAIGLLGAATLLLETMAGNRAALERTRAVILASDMIERIRANRDAGAAYVTADAAPALEPACERADDGCSAEIMAGHDLRRWLDAIAEQLPRAVGNVEVVPLVQGGLRYTVTIAWTQSGTAQPAAYTLETET